MDLVAVFLLGSLVGITELVDRYRDAPLRAIRTSPAILYISINGLAAVIALFFAVGFDFRFGLGETSPLIRPTRILVSGLGAMALFRSSLLTVRAGDQEISIGPASLLQIILRASDRAVDRLRAAQRAQVVTNIMKGVSFTKAVEALPAFCLALMQSLPSEDQAALASEITRLRNSNMDDEIKAHVMGLALMNSLGADVLRSAVDNLGARIK